MWREFLLIITLQCSPPYNKTLNSVYFPFTFSQINNLLCLKSNIISFSITTPHGIMFWSWQPDKSLVNGAGGLASYQSIEMIRQPLYSLGDRTAWTSFSPPCLSWGCSLWRQGLRLCPEAWPQHLPPPCPQWWDRCAGRWGGPDHSAPPAAASATRSTCCWCLYCALLTPPASTCRHTS